MTTKPECPVPTCGYNANMRELDAQLARPLVLQSTRANTSADAHRDFDHFDVNEELARLRRAVHEIKQTLAQDGLCIYHKLWQKSPEAPLLKTLAFVAEAFDNIDENLARLGPLPKAWASARNPKDQGEDEAADEPCRCGPRHVKGRACTPSSRREFVERLLVAWEAFPQERLLQAVINTLGAPTTNDMFSQEDERLLDAMEVRARLLLRGH